MTPHATEIVRRFRALDLALQASKGGEKGEAFPATSPEWHAAIARFYTRGVLQFVARVGRRGGKSSTMCRLAVCEALWGRHEIPAGDIGVVAIVSARRKDALDRLRTIKAILDALGVEYTAHGDAIDLVSRPISFHVFTASIAGVSGFTSIFVLLDEVAKWRDKSTGANPANTVIESIVPTTATMPEARVVLISSPMGLVDAHADAMALGDTEDQMVWYAPTWVANPTLTLERTKKLAKGNEVVWAREYAAIPQAEDELSVFEGRLVTKATRAPVPVPDDERRLKEIGFTDKDTAPDERHRYVATIDPATRGAAWTFNIACLSDRGVHKIVLAREWRGTPEKPLSIEKTFKTIKSYLTAYGIRALYSDNYSPDALMQLARQQDIALVIEPWTQNLKEEAYENMKTLFSEDRIELPPDPQVAQDLLGVRQKITRTGFQYDLAKVGTRHSDYAPAIAMAVLKAVVPPAAAPTYLSESQRMHEQKLRHFKNRELERKRAERFGRIDLPVRRAR